MALGFLITDFLSLESSFTVTANFGVWEFNKLPCYKDILPKLEEGMVGNTFNAFNESVTPTVEDSNYIISTTDLRDICLMLSFITGTCVTPSRTAEYSCIQSLTMGDKFIPPRAVRGLPSLKPTRSTSSFLDKGLPAFNGQYQKHLRLILFHWISALTCYTLEDLFLAICVQFDVVKQVERRIMGNNNLTYFQGMESASSRLSITPLNNDFKNMRNDLVHEGQLSGTNYPGHSKNECSRVIADCLNWLDNYVVVSINVLGELNGQPRWKTEDLEHFLPAFSL